MQKTDNVGKLFRAVIMVLALVTTPLTAWAAAVVDINRADAATMIENWKGIGEKKARAIVAYRKKNGKFSDIDDLSNVKGIGEGIIKNNRKYMSVSKGVFKPSGNTTSSKDTSSKTAKSKSSKKADKKSTSKDSKKAKSKSDTKKSSSKSKDSKSKTSKSTSSKKSTSKKKKKSSKTKKKNCKPNSKDKNCQKKTTKKK